MLKVGRSEVLQILPPDKHELPFHLIVNKYSVPPELRGRPELEFWFSGAEDCYSSNPGSETCDLPFENVKDVYQALLPAHTEAIDNASGNHPSNRSSHQPELVSFVARALGKSPLQPTYVDISDHVSPTFRAVDVTLDTDYRPGRAESRGASSQNIVSPEELERRLQKQAVHGGAGEEHVKAYEEQYLRENGHAELASRVRLVSSENVTAGYDVLSFELSGEEKQIEVKSTNQQASGTIDFHLSVNEFLRAKELSNHYLYYVSDVTGPAPLIRKLKQPFAAMESPFQQLSVPGGVVTPVEVVFRLKVKDSV